MAGGSEPIMGCSCASTGGRATCSIHGGFTIKGTNNVVTSVIRGGRKPPTLTEDECVAVGGHCFESDGITLTSNPPQYPETCKHCGKRRIATPRHPMEYRDG